jgi:putative transposase
VTEYISTKRDAFGIEPICKVLQFAPSTFYTAATRAPSERELHDAYIKEAIEFVWIQSGCRYGADKVWDRLHMDGVPVARCTIERLMRQLGYRGVIRGRAVRTTISDETADRPKDLVDREFSALAPNRLWVADLTYVKTHSGWVYVAFIVDVFSRYVVGWQVSRSLRTDLALDALEMALWKRRGENLDELIHHSDRGVQYVAFSYTERMEAAGIAPSVGSRGDSYDNALAESFNGLYKWELIYKDGPWYGLEDVEHATMEYVHWFNNERIHYGIDKMSPTEFEAAYRSQKSAPAAPSEQNGDGAPKQGAVTRYAARDEVAVTQMTWPTTVTKDGSKREPAATRVVR